MPPRSAAIIYLLLMTYVVLGMLNEVRPMWYYVLAAILFVLSQLDFFLLSKVICKVRPYPYPSRLRAIQVAVSHAVCTLHAVHPFQASDKIDGSFIATLLETAAVSILYFAWRSITEGASPSPPAMFPLSFPLASAPRPRAVAPFPEERSLTRHRPPFRRVVGGRHLLPSVTRPCPTTPSSPSCWAALARLKASMLHAFTGPHLPVAVSLYRHTRFFDFDFTLYPWTGPRSSRRGPRTIMNHVRATYSWTDAHTLPRRVHSVLLFMLSVLCPPSSILSVRCPLSSVRWPSVLRLGLSLSLSPCSCSMSRISPPRSVIS